MRNDFFRNQCTTKPAAFPQFSGKSSQASKHPPKFYQFLNFRSYDCLTGTRVVYWYCIEIKGETSIMNQQSYQPDRPKSRPFDYDLSSGQSKPAPSPEFEEIFRRAKQRQQQTRPSQPPTPKSAGEPTRPYDPLPFPAATKRTKPVHLETGKTQLERDTTAAVLENVQRRYGGASQTEEHSQSVSVGISAYSAAPSSRRTFPQQSRGEGQQPPRQQTAAVPEQYQYAMEQYQAQQQKQNQSGAKVKNPAADSWEEPAEVSPKEKGNKKKKKKKHRKITCCLIPFLLLVALVVAGIFAFQYYFGGLQTDHTQYTDEELGINSAGLALDEQNITNIALFGVDSREGDDSGRSDATIILSIDQEHGKIKLTSIARDTYCQVPGHGETKLCHAYFYGGPQLAMETLNSNFDLNIRDYATVNFDQMADIIDAVGGVDIEVDENELFYTNSLQNYYVETEGRQPNPIQSTGLVTLDGEQAVCYSRIRKESGGDDARTNRQREVLEALLAKIKTQPIWTWPDLCRQLLPMMETSLDYTDIMWLSISLLGDVQMEMTSFPNENSDASGETISGTWYYVYDLDVAKQQIYDFIYNDILPVQPDTEE